MDATALPSSTPRAVALAGRSVSFAVVADDGRRSASWTAWTSKNTPDAYIAARSIAGLSKVSLHHSGSWQYGFTESGAERWIPPGGSRHLALWQRPEPFAPGFYKAFQIMIPDCELRSWPDGVAEPRAHKVLRLPSPGDGSAACIDCFFAPGGSWQLDPVDPAIDVARLLLVDGGQLVVMARKIGWLDVDRRWLDGYRAAALASVPPNVMRRAAAPRLHFGGARDDGTRFLIDVAPDAGSNRWRPTT